MLKGGWFMVKGVRVGSCYVEREVVNGEGDVRVGS